MSEQGVYLVAGLGNPGPEYAETRHNAGFMTLDALASVGRIAVTKRKFDVLYGRGTIGGVGVLLAKPQAYMNRSGPPLRALADYFRIQRQAMIVVHDDIDLAFQRLQIKEKGGDGGHKGIRSIMDAFGSGDFVRVRIGVGRSAGNRDVVGHVLGTFDPDEKQALDELLRTASEAITAILTKGTTHGMNRYNQNPR
ncbi:MAG: aminoacyl-tRNA hydrolase [Desulfatitalea sp.]|nr:aminoacyl-tRNA hydrolase [Desulfatitalea sp.]